MRTFKEEPLALTKYKNLQDAQEQIGQFNHKVYQPKRIHSSLRYLTPAEFESKYRQMTVQ